MTEKQRKQFNRMRYVLRKIHRAYQTPQQLRKSSEKEHGLDYEETLEMAYENLQTEAANGYRGIKEIPPPKKPERKKVTRKIMAKVEGMDIQANQVIFFRCSRKRWMTKDRKELSDEFIGKHNHQLPKDNQWGWVLIK